jgi:hypothetical protein
MYVTTPFGGGDLFFTSTDFFDDDSKDSFRVLAGTPYEDMDNNFKCTSIRFESPSGKYGSVKRNQEFTIVFAINKSGIEEEWEFLSCYLVDPKTDGYGALCVSRTVSTHNAQTFTIPYEGIEGESGDCIPTNGFILFINGTNMLKSTLSNISDNYGCGLGDLIGSISNVSKYHNTIKFESKNPGDPNWGWARFSLI